LDVINPNPNALSGSTAIAATFPLNSTPNITLLNAVTIGSSSWNRIGRKISMLSGHFIANPILVNASSVVQYARVVLVYDKQTNGSAPSWDDIFRDNINSASDINTSGAYNVYAGINLNNRDRFEIIMDQRMLYPASDTSAIITQTEELQQMNCYHKLGNREVHFKADSAPGVIGDVSTGGLFLITAGNITEGSEAFGLQVHFRMRYSDL